MWSSSTRPRSFSWTRSAASSVRGFESLPLRVLTACSERGRPSARRLPTKIGPQTSANLTIVGIRQAGGALAHPGARRSSSDSGALLQSPERAGLRMRRGKRSSERRRLAGSEFALKRGSADENSGDGLTAPQRSNADGFEATASLGRAARAFCALWNAGDCGLMPLGSCLFLRLPLNLGSGKLGTPCLCSFANASAARLLLSGQGRLRGVAQLQLPHDCSPDWNARGWVPVQRHRESTQATGLTTRAEVAQRPSSACVCLVVQFSGAR